MSSMRRWVKGFCQRSEAVRDVRERFGAVAIGSEPKDVAGCLFDWSKRMFNVGIEEMVECASMGLMRSWPQIGLFMNLS